MGRTDEPVRRGHSCGVKLEKWNITAHWLDQTPAGAAAKPRSASRSEPPSLVRHRHHAASSEVHAQRRPRSSPLISPSVILGLSRLSHRLARRYRTTASPLHKRQTLSCGNRLRRTNRTSGTRLRICEVGGSSPSERACIRRSGATPSSVRDGLDACPGCISHNRRQPTSQVEEPPYPWDLPARGIIDGGEQGRATVPPHSASGPRSPNSEA